MSKGTVLKEKMPFGTVTARSAFKRGDEVFFFDGRDEIPAEVVSVSWPTFAAGQREADAIVHIRFNQTQGPYRRDQILSVKDHDLSRRRRGRGRRVENLGPGLSPRFFANPWSER